MDISSSTHRLVMGNVDKARFILRANTMVESISEMFNAKLGKCQFVVYVASELLKWISEALVPLGTPIVRTEWAKPIERVKGLTYVHMLWESCVYPRQMFKDGILTKEDVVIMLQKDPVEKAWLKEQCYFIDLWHNAELDMGFLFPDCDAYHRVFQPWALDADNVFTVKQCKCGMQGEAFTVYHTIKGIRQPEVV